MITATQLLANARKHLGEAEIKGPKHNAAIVNLWRKIEAPFRDDETAWCAALVGAVLVESGLPAVKGIAGARAMSYHNYGIKLPGPAVGAIVLLWRETITNGKGHIGFCVGRDANGNILVLGGNQGDRVCVKAFAPSRVLSYHLPVGVLMPSRFGFEELTYYTSADAVSTNEA
jgi:uncharacterized protein (TIGR02594 family)